MEIKGLLQSQRKAAAFEGMIMNAVDRATRQEAHLLREGIVRGLRDQNPGGGNPILPLSEMTILLRGLPRSGGGGGKKKGRGGIRIVRTKRDRSGRLRRGGRFVRSENARAGFSIQFGRGRKKSSSRKSRSSKTPKRGHSKALIDRGDLIGGISVRQVSWAHYTVGVHRGERGRQGGGDLVNIAEIHEYGTQAYTITVTEKMSKFSKFLVVKGILKAPWPVGKVLHKKTPARPFLGPSHESWERNAGERFSTRLDVFLLERCA